MSTQSLLIHFHLCWCCKRMICYAGAEEDCLHGLWKVKGQVFTTKDCKECHTKHTAHLDPRLEVLTHINEDFSEDEAYLVLFPNEAPKWLEKRLIGW
jgi:hypothetical protein